MGKGWPIIPIPSQAKTGLHNRDVPYWIPEPRLIMPCINDVPTCLFISSLDSLDLRRAAKRAYRPRKTPGSPSRAIVSSHAAA